MHDNDPHDVAILEWQAKHAGELAETYRTSQDYHTKAQRWVAAGHYRELFETAQESQALIMNKLIDLKG